MLPIDPSIAACNSSITPMAVKSTALPAALTAINTKTTSTTPSTLTASVKPITAAAASAPSTSPNNEEALQKEKETLLMDRPGWKYQLGQMYDVSLVDQVWLLKVIELDTCGIDLEPVEKCTSMAIKSGGAGWTEYEMRDLLRNKTLIDEALKKITKCNLLGKCKMGEPRRLPHENRNLIRQATYFCPSSLDLLPNLEELDLSYNQFATPPNLSKNVKLKSLSLHSNPLLTSAGDLSNLTQLEWLSLEKTALTSPPVVRSNVLLKYLFLSNSGLTSAPDISQNKELLELHIDGNPLTAPVDTSHNSKLVVKK